MSEGSDRPEESAPEKPGGGEGGGSSGSSGSGKGDTPVRLPQGVGDLLLFVPRLALLLGRLIADPEVASTDKLLLAAVVAYIMSPIDIVPDFIPVIGQLDDAYLVALCLLRLMNRSGTAKVRQYWDGPEDIVAFLHTITDVATRYLPDPARGALRGWIDARDPNPPPQ